jgi:peptidoglycan/xylan/chitin deacetylase (PgdA/CDA1 family)
MTRIPILLYHDICDEAHGLKDNFCVTQENFRQQMEYLHRNGFVGVSLAKIIAEQEYWKGEEAKGEKVHTDTRKKVVLTFDDGSLSDYNVVFPILREIGFTATFFVTINEIGKENRMDWAMVYELSRNNMDIGSHGMVHSFLTAFNNYTLLNELILSKQILEKYTRKRVDFLSIPQGFYNKRVLTIAKDVGFKAACSSDAGYNDFSNEALFLMKRITIRRNYSLKGFKSIIQGHPSPVIAISEALRTRLRNLLGWQVYDRLRQIRYKKNHRI